MSALAASCNPCHLFCPFLQDPFQCLGSSRALGMLSLSISPHGKHGFSVILPPPSLPPTFSGINPPMFLVVHTGETILHPTFPAQALLASPHTPFPHTLRGPSLPYCFLLLSTVPFTALIGTPGFRTEATFIFTTGSLTFCCQSL